jgi:hypothetical protein
MDFTAGGGTYGGIEPGRRLLTCAFGVHAIERRIAPFVPEAIGFRL